MASIRHAGSQRGHEEHRPPGHGRGLEGVSDAADAGGRCDRRSDDRPATRSCGGSTNSGRTRRSRTRSGSVATDPDSRIAKMKDGTTHLAYKAEHVVDLETEMIVAAEVYHADHGRHADAGRQRAAGPDQPATSPAATCQIRDVAADKGYHAAEHAGRDFASTRPIARTFPSRSCRPRLHAGPTSRRSNRRRCTPTAGGPAAQRGQAAATPTQRAGGAELRSCLRDGRRAADVAGRHRESSQALSDCRGRSQSGLPHAQAVRNGHAAGAAGVCGPCPGFVSCHPDAALAARKPNHQPRT